MFKHFPEIAFNINFVMIISLIKTQLQIKINTWGFLIRQMPNQHPNHKSPKRLSHYILIILYNKYLYKKLKNLIDLQKS